MARSWWRAAPDPWPGPSSFSSRTARRDIDTRAPPRSGFVRPLIAARAAVEDVVHGRAYAAVLGDQLAHDEDQRRDRPEVTADPQDAGADLLVCERRQRHAGDVVVD